MQTTVGPTVLLIDGDALSACVYETRFAREGFHVLRANDGEEGVRMAQVEVPDMILLDVQLPHGDGVEVLRHLKRTPSLRSVPVMILSDADGVEDVERCLREGAEEYFVKACSIPGETVRSVKTILGFS